MFMHAYDNYIYNAYPLSNLLPISCTGSKFDLIRIPMVTLIDTMDTLYLMGNYTEFFRNVERLRGMRFGVDQNVSVFETNIR